MDPLIWSDIVSDFLLTIYIFSMLSFFVFKDKRKNENKKIQIKENFQNEEKYNDNEEKIEIVIV